MLSVTAKVLFHHVFHCFGLPEDVMTDQGPQFMYQVWQAFIESLGINVSLTLWHHSESNGQVERPNHELGQLEQLV